MGKTHAKRMEARGERLKQMPRKERFAKSAEIKKREGRVLDANEKRAIKMKGNHGAVMRAWEILRASADKREEKLEAMKHQAKMHGANESELALMKEDFENASGGRDAAVAKVLVLLKSKFEDMARTPTGSRVIQSCIKFGTNEQRQQILMLFTPKFTEYCTDGFAHFAIEGLIRHATKPDFKSMLSMILNVMSALATHKCGLRVVNALYNHKLCSATEKHLLVLGIFKDSVAVMKGWKGYPILEDIIEGEAGHRRRLVSALFDVTDKLVTQKEAVDYPFVQRLLCVLFTRGAREQIEELAATLKTNLIPIAQSRDGARLASLVFGVLPPKSRKVVLQAVAQNFLELATGKYSPPFLMRCFDLTYDPQMSAKYLTTPLVKDIGPISGSPYGCRLILHLLTPDADRKARVMLPGFEEHNLYSRNNTAWNEHTWYDEQMNEETVRICEHDAESNHMPSLAAIGKAFCDVVCSVKGLDTNKTLKGFVARIAAEMYFVHENEDKYRAALGLTDSQVEQLRTLRSNKDRKLDGDEDDETAEEALPTPAKKKHLPEAAAATRKSPAAAAAPAAAPKPDAAATPKAKSPASSKQAVATTPASQRKGPSVADRSTVLDLDGDDDAVVEVSARQSTTVASAPRKSTGTAPAAAPRSSKQLAAETPTRKSALKGGNSAAVAASPNSAQRKSVRILDAI